MGTADLPAIDRIDFDAPWARALSLGVALAGGFAACVAGGVILYTTLIGRFHAAPLLLIPGAPLLAVGQLWCVVVVIRRVNDRQRAEGVRRWFDGFIRPRDVRGGLPRAAAVGLLGAFNGAVVGAALSMESAAANAADSIAATAAQQRSVAGVFAAFFVAHCGVATGEVLLRRRGD